MKKCSLFILKVFIFLVFGVVFAEESNAKYSLSSCSLKYSFPCVTLKGSWKIPSCSFDSSPELYTPAWGASLSFSETKLKNIIPLSLLFGTVTPQGSFSKLKNPAMYNTNYSIPLSFQNVSMLTSSLPTSSNCEKPMALCTSLKLSTNSFFNKMNVTVFADENNNIYQGAAIVLKTSKKTTLSFSEVSGKFTKENESLRWFSKTKLFPKTDFYATNIQTSFFSPFFKTRVSADLFYTPTFEDTFQFTFCSENLIKLNYFLLNLSFFCTDDKETFTASSRLKTLSQIKINPAINFYPLKNKLKVQAGTLFFLQQKIQSDESVALEKKLGGQLNFYTKNTFTRLYCVTQGIDEAEKINGAIYFYTKKKFIPSQNMAFSVIPNENFLNLKHTQKVYFKGKKVYTSISASESVLLADYKDAESFCIETKMSCSAKTKNLYFSISAGLSFDIL